MEAYELEWTETSLDDLEGILAYLAFNGSVETAERMRDAIIEHVALLKAFPFIGPLFARDRAKGTREILCRKYRIFYRVDEAARRVRILTIWHSSRRDPELP
jgi:plasmid stabilization system protein ParE